ncbi:PDZ domain [Plasmopara halstedii]|uniref:PDZ domain n=1 Tax=Plasmopara halstedii TaxID=4781 RepID=A0A0P1A935_PLAHL|nr:PDZ domain [Plasmopara halstedii]CEG36804.1 PDZ domain [Plasmopara halstedii]|eukprot:XP_024573173.1 PDZ domain [Plasmopara halstedii]
MAGEQQKVPEDSKNGISAVPPSSGGMQTFAPLAFDESLMAPASALEIPNSSESMTNSKSAADFFLDQIAAVVSDEKKLSDNIMDLIPPVEAPMTQGEAVTQMITPTALSIGMPLQPPPDLIMRALSPPTSLLPDFGDVTSLSLLGDATSAAATPTMTTITTAVKRELSMVKPAVAETPGSIRKKAEVATAASIIQKKQKVDDIKPDTVVSAATAVVHQPIVQQARQNYHNSNNPLSVAAAAAAAREKVMKEPQSGDLYECVITKRNGGLGLTLACVDDHVQITGLAPDTPAASSGICVGDTLVAVSGLPVRGLQFSTVIGRLKSTSRNSVVLKLRRNPFRQNAGNITSSRGNKRPCRGGLTGSDSSNSANVLTSKTMALESRLGGGMGNGSNGSASVASNNSHEASVGTDDLHRTHYQGGSGLVSHASSLHEQHLQLYSKAEPLNSTYFPTDASILTMGATSAGAVPPSVFAPSSLFPSDSQVGWRVNCVEKERYYAECRALRHELGRAMVAQQIQKRDTKMYTSQIQAVIDKFQDQVRELSVMSSSVGIEGAVNCDELGTLRQKLVEANQKLAQQHTDMLVLKERESRHALPEAQRIKWQLVSYLRKSVLQIDCKSAVKQTSTSAVSKGNLTPLSFEKRLDGVRPSTFTLLMGRNCEQSDGPTIELELNAKMCTELLGWNMREVVVQAGARFIVSVDGSILVKYLQREEVLAVSWTLRVNESNKDDNCTLSLRNCT